MTKSATFPSSYPALETPTIVRTCGFGAGAGAGVGAVGNVDALCRPAGWLVGKAEVGGVEAGAVGNVVFGDVGNVDGVGGRGAFGSDVAGAGGRDGIGGGGAGDVGNVDIGGEGPARAEAMEAGGCGSAGITGAAGRALSALRRDRIS